MQWLQQQGYQRDFNLDTDCLKAADLRLNPEDFEIDYVFRFEGETDPADETVIYGIASPALGEYGILVNAYGMYADSLTNEMVQKLS